MSTHAQSKCQQGSSIHAHCLYRCSGTYQNTFICHSGDYIVQEQSRNSVKKRSRFPVLCCGTHCLMTLNQLQSTDTFKRLLKLIHLMLPILFNFKMTYVMCLRTSRRRRTQLPCTVTVKSGSLVKSGPSKSGPSEPGPSKSGPSNLALGHICEIWTVKIWTVKSSLGSHLILICSPTLFCGLRGGVLLEFFYKTRKGTRRPTYS